MYNLFSVRGEMRNKLIYFFIAAVSLFSFPALALDETSDELTAIKLVLQYSQIKPGSNNILEIKFELAKGWHFYADEKTAPQGTNLKINAQGQGLVFSNPVLPKSEPIFDEVTNQTLDVYSGAFSIFVPFTTESNSLNSEIKVAIDGVACSRQLCRKASYELTKNIEISPNAQIDKPVFAIPVEQTPTTGVEAKPITVLVLAILAGLLLNVMPCVWPVLPIIVMRLVGQAQKSKAKSIMFGVAFAIGILLFFAALAVVNIILKFGFGLVFQWGDQFRNPAFVTGMALLMVVLALYMFGLFTFGIPASVSSGKQTSGFTGSVGMGFLAAVLSTPCSFAILTFVLAWAQTQPIPLATITILLIGVGMAAPYVVLTMIPKLLTKIPKPGRWMELFKHATGFVLLAIAVKLLEAAPLDKIINILYYAVVLAVCIWMWGVCVSYDTPESKKWTIRFIAVLLAILFAFLLLATPQKGLINWQPYDAENILTTQKDNRPVLIDFTADWCLSCKILDKTVYADKKIADLIKQKDVLAIKADTTRYDYPATIALKEVYKEPAVPVTILLLPGKETPIKLRGNLIKTELKEYLQNLPNRNQNSEK